MPCCENNKQMSNEWQVRAVFMHPTEGPVHMDVSTGYCSLKLWVRFSYFSFLRRA